MAGTTAGRQLVPADADDDAVSACARGDRARENPEQGG